MMRRRCLRPSSICWSAQLHASVLFQDGKVFVKKRSRPIDSPEKEVVEPLFLCTKNVMQGGLAVVGRCRRTNEDDDVLDYFAVDIPSSMNVEPFVSGCPRLHYRISRSPKLWRFDVNLLSIQVTAIAANAVRRRNQSRRGRQESVPPVRVDRRVWPVYGWVGGR